MSYAGAFESEEKKRSKSHFKNLLSVALADGILDKAELDYIFKVSKRFYITRDELESLLDNPGQIIFSPPTDKEERIRQLYNLVHMMLIDGEIDPNEMRLCMSFGVGLGFAPASIEDTINKIVNSIEAGEEKEDVIEDMMKWAK
jgi:uncharacterized tellurite resistance protein B-like protein